MATILVVDDIETNSRSLARYVGLAGHRVLQAPGGEEALAILGSHPLQLIISDIRMPGIDGFELARRIQCHPIHSQIPIIFYTAGYSEDDASICTLHSGVFRVLSKSSRPEVILKTIAAALAVSATPIRSRQEIDPTAMTAIDWTDLQVRQ
jgi:CheY-like chemotaxis protein